MCQVSHQLQASHQLLVFAPQIFLILLRMGQPLCCEDGQDGSRSRSDCADTADGL